MNTSQKILLVNVFIVGENSGTGNTVKNILSNYPSDKIMQMCLAEKCEQNKTSITNTEYVTPAFNKLISYIRRRRNEAFSSITVNQMAQQRTLRTAVHEFFSGLLDFFPRHFKNIYDKTDAFKPDVIFTCGASGLVLKSALKLSQRYNAPIILMLMDDWPETIYRKSILSAPFRIASMRILKQCCEHSFESFAISEALADKYHRKYEIPFLPLMNPAMHIEDSVILPENDTMVFIYAGALSLNRWKSLLDIARLLHEANDAGMKNIFNLYVPPNSVDEFTARFSPFNVRLHAYVPVDKVYDVYKESDVLVFTESFDESVRKFTSLSLSTKIPEYMGSGRPILAYLPHELHSAEYINSRKAGLVCKNISELEKGITQILTDKALRQSLANAGIVAVKREHSVESETAKFLHAIGSDKKK